MQLQDQATGLVSVGGYFDSNQLQLNEQQLRQKIIKLLEQHYAQLNEKNFSAKDISTVFNSNLYKTFLKKVNAKNLEKEKHDQLVNTLIAAITSRSQ